MDITIHQFRCLSKKQVPLLFVFANNLESAAQKGVVLFYHGLSSKKECNLKEFKDIAKNGFLAIGIDAVGHGQRLWPDFTERFNSDVEENLTNIVHDTCWEIPDLLDELIKDYGASPDKLAIAGISMGAYITFLALTIDRRFRVALPILGSPFFPAQPELSPCHKPELFFPVAMLIQNAAQDKSVDPQYARQFALDLQSFYQEQPEKLQYVEFPESGHFMQEGEWHILWNNCLHWLQNHLGSV